MRLVFLILCFMSFGLHAQNLSNQIHEIYQSELTDTFEFFHSHAELSLMEHRTSARLAEELRERGFDVSEGIGGTGLIAILENGTGPMVMVRADMDGLPIKEATGLSYASTNKQIDPDGNEVFVMHACGHDIHMSSLIGTASFMSANRDLWQGTLMLLGQPAEERVLGARNMMAENIWDDYGVPDYALALHVSAETPSGQLFVTNASPYSGADTIDIIVHGIGSHGATPHQGIDPIVLGSQIVIALQSIISRDLAPRESGVITVGS